MLPMLALFACTAPGVDTAVDTDVDTAPPPTSTRIVLHEVFSGSNCGPCLEAAASLEAALVGNEGRYALVEYQIGSDPYITQEASGRRTFYMPGESDYIPWIQADGTHGFHPNDMGEGEAYAPADLAALADIPSELDVHLQMEVTGQRVDITVSLRPTADIVGGDLRLMVSINENITHLNVGSNGQTEFHNVMKKFVPDEGGTSLGVLEASETYVHELSHTFPGDYDEEVGYPKEVDHDEAHTVEEFEDLKVVAWVQDFSTWEVFNSNWIGSGVED